MQRQERSLPEGERIERSDLDRCADRVHSEIANDVEQIECQSSLSLRRPACELIRLCPSPPVMVPQFVRVKRTNDTMLRQCGLPGYIELRPLQWCADVARDQAMRGVMGAALVNED